MGEAEGGAGDVADLSGAGGCVLEDAPAPFEQVESSFAEGAKAGQEPVVDAVVGAESLSVGGAFDRG